MKRQQVSRRKFIKHGAMVCGAAYLFTRCDRGSSAWNFFTKKEAAQIKSLCSLIIPADDEPGALEANVVGFIDKQLSSTYSRWQEDYRLGLAATDATSKKVFGKPFLDLSPENINDLMQRFEENRVPEGTWRHKNASTFFNLLIDHCMQGFYGDPRHGGNLNHVSYKMLRLEVIDASLIFN
ncbi:MAG: gluconate 2-dehydrogenase subunit 3 family protein [Cyclobacteriaceae bacterium]|nr:gluconate 2-dehydrogenase subunit 3 family protein [Cyclobacteriaceae bacterium]